MARPRQYQDGTSVFSFSVGDDRLSQYLERYKDANPRGFSAMICESVQVRLGSADRDLLNLKLRAIDLEIMAARKELLHLEEEKAGLEARLRSVDAMKEELTDRRLQLLERAKRSGWLDRYRDFEGWATGPVGLEALAACGYEDPKAAYDWMVEHVAPMLQR